MCIDTFESSSYPKTSLRSRVSRRKYRYGPLDENTCGPRRRDCDRCEVNVIRDIAHRPGYLHPFPNERGNQPFYFCRSMLVKQAQEVFGRDIGGHLLLGSCRQACINWRSSGDLWTAHSGCARSPGRRARYHSSTGRSFAIGSASARPLWTAQRLLHPPRRLLSWA
jgi:hypothetical protein